MRRNSLGWLALVGALAISPARAQSLIELFHAARSYDAIYLAAQAQYAASIAQAAQTQAGILPQAGMSVTATHAQLEVSVPRASALRGQNNETAGLTVSQPLYRPANWAAYQQGKRQVDVAQAKFTLAEQDLLVRVSQAYFDVLGSQDSVTLVRAQKAAVVEQLAAAKRNFELGATTITDTREAQARYDLVIAQEIAAENDLQVKKIGLDELVGRPGSAPLPLATPVRLPKLAPADIAAWVTQAEEQHPAIQVAGLTLDIATLEVDKAEAGHKPTLDLQASYNVNNNPQGTTSSLYQSWRVNTASVGLVFNLPLFAGFATENRIKETLALKDQARELLEGARRSVSQATRAAYLGLTSDVAQVRALKAAEVSSQSALDANLLSYQIGVRVNIDVLNAQRQLFQTRRDLAQARYRVLMDNLKLRQANGSLSPNDLLPINAMLSGTHATVSEPTGDVPAPKAGQPSDQPESRHSRASASPDRSP